MKGRGVSFVGTFFLVGMVLFLAFSPVGGQERRPLPPVSGQERGLGLFLIEGPRPGLEVQRIQRQRLPLDQLPTSLDWRDNGGNYVTSVKSQGACGSCWAFAACGALESMALIVNGTPIIDGGINLSEQLLVSCNYGWNYGGYSNIGCGGGYSHVTAEHLKLYGVPVESCYSYIAKDPSDGAPCSGPLLCGPCGEDRWFAREWDWITWQPDPIDILSVKTWLHDYGPIYASMDIWADFYYAYTSGVYDWSPTFWYGGTEYDNFYVAGHAVMAGRST